MSLALLPRFNAQILLRRRASSSTTRQLSEWPHDARTATVAHTASKKQANCTGGKSICGYHAQWGCTTCEEGKADFKR